MTVRSGLGAPRRDLRKTIAVVSVALVVLAVIIAVALASRGAVSSSASTAPASAVLKVGQSAPPFAVSTTAGPFDLAQNGGKPTLLEVFATWCPHCQRETAVLNRLHATFGSRANIVSVSGSALGSDGQTPETQVDVVAFATKFGVRYPIAFDPNLAVANAYLQGGFPTFVAIDARNVVRAVDTGEVAEAKLAGMVRNALAASAAAPR